MLLFGFVVFATICRIEKCCAFMPIFFFMRLTFAFCGAKQSGSNVSVYLRDE